MSVIKRFPVTESNPNPSRMQSVTWHRKLSYGYHSMQSTLLVRPRRACLRAAYGDLQCNANCCRVDLIASASALTSLTFTPGTKFDSLTVSCQLKSFLHTRLQ